MPFLEEHNIGVKKGSELISTISSDNSHSFYSPFLGTKTLHFLSNKDLSYIYYDKSLGDAGVAYINNSGSLIWSTKNPDLLGLGHIFTPYNDNIMVTYINKSDYYIYINKYNNTDGSLSSTTKITTITGSSSALNKLYGKIKGNILYMFYLIAGASTIVSTVNLDTMSVIYTNQKTNDNLFGVQDDQLAIDSNYIYTIYKDGSGNVYIYKHSTIDFSLSTSKSLGALSDSSFSLFLINNETKLMGAYNNALNMVSPTDLSDLNDTIPYSSIFGNNYEVITNMQVYDITNDFYLITSNLGITYLYDVPNKQIITKVFNDKVIQTNAKLLFANTNTNGSINFLNEFKF